MKVFGQFTLSSKYTEALNRYFTVWKRKEDSLLRHVSERWLLLLWAIEKYLMAVQYFNVFLWSPFSRLCDCGRLIKQVQKIVDTLPFKKWRLITFPLSVDWTDLTHCSSSVC